MPLVQWINLLLDVTTVPLGCQSRVSADALVVKTGAAQLRSASTWQSRFAGIISGTARLTCSPSVVPIPRVRFAGRSALAASVRVVADGFRVALAAAAAVRGTCSLFAVGEREVFDGAVLRSQSSLAGQGYLARSTRASLRAGSLVGAAATARFVAACAARVAASVSAGPLVEITGYVYRANYYFRYALGQEVTYHARIVQKITAKYWDGSRAFYLLENGYLAPESELDRYRESVLDYAYELSRGRIADESIWAAYVARLPESPAPGIAAVARPMDFIGPEREALEVLAANMKGRLAAILRQSRDGQSSLGGTVLRDRVLPPVRDYRLLADRAKKQLEKLSKVSPQYR